MMTGQVIQGMSVAQNGTPNMTVLVAAGSARIPTGTSPSDHGYFVAIDTSGGESVTITTANPSNPRIDTIVAYVDKSVTAATSPANNPNSMLKLAAVAGTPAGSPSAPSGATIQSAVGAANPYITLANVLVGAAVSSILTANITDTRTMASAVLAAGAVGTTQLASSSVTSSKVATGACVQQVSTLSSTVISTTTLLPYDNTIPQNTEGEELMTCAITPKSATNILSIEALALCSFSVVSKEVTLALFQDSTANAISVGPGFSQAVQPGPVQLKLTHTMVAGTTSATTFKIRGGAGVAGTFKFNTSSGLAAMFGGLPISSIVIREYKA